MRTARHSNHVMQSCAAGLAALAVIVGSLVATGSAAGADGPVGREGDPRMPLVQEINLLEPDGTPRPLHSAPPTFFVDAARREVIATGATESTVYLIDPDSMEQTGALDISAVPRHLNQGAVIAYDRRHRRLLFGEKDTAAHAVIQRKTDRISVPRKVHSVDVETGSMSSFEFTDDFAGQGVRALAYDSTRDVVFAVTELQVPPSLSGLTGGRQMFLHALDAGKLATDPASAWMWAYEVPAICLQFLQGASIGSPPYLGVGTDGGFVYFACRGFPDPSTLALNANAGLNGVDPTQNGVLVLPLDWPAGSAAPSIVPEFFPFAGALFNGFGIGDAAGERVVVVPAGGTQNKVFVFDARHRAWSGAFPLGNTNITGATVDSRSGRLYLFDQDAGIALSDMGVVPVSQGSKIDQGTEFTFQDPGFDPLTRRLFAAGTYWANGPPSHIRVYEDRTAALVAPSPRDPDSETHQISEDEASDVTFNGGGGAFGMRAMWVGGLNRAPFGSTAIAAMPEGERPSGSDRGTFSALVNETQLAGSLSGGSATARAVGLLVDDATSTEVEGVPGFGAMFEGAASEVRPSSCADFGGESGDAREPGSEVACREGEGVEARAWSSDRMSSSPIKVAWSTSNVQLKRDVNRGVVVTSTASASGIEISLGAAGSIQLGEVRSSAETWAHGLKGTADSEFKAMASNVRFTDPSGAETVVCKECDIRTVVRAINENFNNRVQAETGKPSDERSMVGSPGGARAILAKDDFSYWSGFNVNGDDRQELPALQLTLFIDGAQPSRLILQLAAVRAESQYRIGAPKPPVVTGPTKLSLKLIDDAGKLLPGGVFQVRSAGAGVAGGLTSTVEGACVTSDDGVGDCEFDDLAPGDYRVSQVNAPEGYARAADAEVTLEPDSRTDVVFTNLRSVGGITVTLSDDDGSPLPGAEFTVLSDDGDLVYGPADQEYATCTTDQAGACAFDEVPLGAYVVRQTKQPPEYLRADDVGFILEQPGQIANLSFATGLEPIAGSEGISGSTEEIPVDDEQPVDTAFVDEPTETTTVVVTNPPMAPIAQVTSRPLRDRSGPSLRDVAQIPAEVVGYLARNPRQAALFGLVWLLFGAPLYLGARRRFLTLRKAVA